MAITDVSSVQTGAIRMYEEERKVTGTSDLGQDAFMQILVTQLANQDPLSPASDTEFIAQMAQFTSLEQMQAMNQTIQSQSAYNYLGKEISSNYVYNSATGLMSQQDVFGYVESINKIGNAEYLQVMDYNSGNIVLVPPDQVSQVLDGSKVSNTVSNMTVDELKDLLGGLGKDVIDSLLDTIDKKQEEDIQDDKEIQKEEAEEAVQEEIIQDQAQEAAEIQQAAQAAAIESALLSL